MEVNEMAKKNIINNLISDCKQLYNLTGNFNDKFKGDRVQYAIHLRNMSYQELLEEYSTLQREFYNKNY